MKRKLISILLGVSITVSLLTGCGTNGTANEKETVQITKKMEQEYAARIEAYQEYYQSVLEEYGRYEIGANITLDSEHLPVLWILIADSMEVSNSGMYTTQLVGYVDGKASVLAEKGDILIPFRGDFVMACDWYEDNYYLYDEDKKNFVLVNDEIGVVADVDDTEAVFTEEEIEEIKSNLSKEELEYRTKLWECTQSIYAMHIGVNESQKKVLYLGTYTEDAYIFPDGTTCKPKEAKWLIPIVYQDVWKDGDNWSTGAAQEAAEYAPELSIKRMFRDLLKNPLYTQEELFLYIVSVAYECEIVEMDTYDYSLSKASDNYIADLLKAYLTEESYYDGFFTEEFITDRDSFLKTEPLEKINSKGIKDCVYKDNVLTLDIYGTDLQYEFEIEFTESGDNISKITYIDPLASMTEEEKLEHRMKYEILPAYETYVRENFANDTSENPYSFIFLNDDEIPELVIQGNCEAVGNIICTYINDSVVSMSTRRLLAFSFLEKQNLLCDSGGRMGNYYDTVYSIGEEEFTVVADGNWSESYDEEGNFALMNYVWNEQQVSAEEYSNALAQVYDNTQQISCYDLLYYNSISQAYENLGKR